MSGPGLVIHDTPIAVDFFYRWSVPSVKLFFLTHAHADHTAGLTPNWSENLYCSPVTAKIVAHKFGVDESLLRPLEVGAPFLVPMDEEGGEMLTVTPIAADHCPGAVMFLFEGYFGCVLCTGDFRPSPAMYLNPRLPQPGVVDTLYLDNTYMSDEYVFPSRAEATDVIVAIVESHPDHEVMIGLHTLGKEDLLIDVALRLKRWVAVDGFRLWLASVMGWPDVLTGASSDTNIRVVRQKAVTQAFVNRRNDVRPTIAILPTALFEGAGHAGFRDSGNVFVVPYSDHASYPEMLRFVERLAPSKVVPLLKRNRRPFGGGLTPSSVECFRDLLSPAKSVEPAVVPASVQRFMRPRTWQKARPPAERPKRSCRKRKRFKSMGVAFSVGSDDEERAVDEIVAQIIRDDVQPDVATSESHTENQASPTNDNTENQASPTNDNTEDQASPTNDNTEDQASPTNDNTEDQASPTNDNIIENQTKTRQIDEIYQKYFPNATTATREIFPLSTNDEFRFFNQIPKYNCNKTF